MQLEATLHLLSIIPSSCGHMAFRRFSGTNVLPDAPAAGNIVPLVLPHCEHGLQQEKAMFSPQCSAVLHPQGLRSDEAHVR
jgi:hypothetical protein